MLSRHGFRPLRLVLACALATGCSDSAAPGGARAAEADAPGSVIAIELDGRRATITAEEVDSWLPTIRRIEPTATLPALRRFALTNISLPLCVSTLIDPDAREEARVRAQDSWDVIQEGLIEYKDLAEMEAVEGNFKETGLDVWGMALEMEVDDWSPIFETVGAFVFFRFVAIPEPPWDGGTPILIERGVFPYLDAERAREQIEAAYDRAHLKVLDPEWEAVLPAHYLYRMKPE